MAAIIFQINYVGSSTDAQKFVRELERDDQIGDLVFCNPCKASGTLYDLSDSGR
jgi:hypothetical protein